MRVINRKELDKFKRKHPQSVRPLTGWESIMTRSEYRHFNELRKTFPSADYLPSGYTVFNIGGNKFRLITEIEYSFRMVEIKAIWTHAEYSQAKYVERLRRGEL
jgi:mRNA interferase HigB